MSLDNQSLTSARTTTAHAVGLFICTAAVLAFLLSMPRSTIAQTTKDGSPNDTTSIKLNPLVSKVFPLVVITNNFNLVVGQAYSLIYSTTVLGRSDYGYVNFNGQGSSVQYLRAWLECGYNPAITTHSAWVQRCPQYASVNGEGPTRYWLGSKSPNFDKEYFAPSLSAGEGVDGWWLEGWGGSSICSYIDDMDQQEYVIPMADIVHTSGNRVWYHTRALYTFHIQNSYCQSSNGDWYIEGVLLPK